MDVAEQQKQPNKLDNSNVQTQEKVKKPLLGLFQIITKDQEDYILKIEYIVINQQQQKIERAFKYNRDTLSISQFLKNVVNSIYQNYIQFQIKILPIPVFFNSNSQDLLLENLKNNNLQMFDFLANNSIQLQLFLPSQYLYESKKIFFDTYDHTIDEKSDFYSNIILFMNRNKVFLKELHRCKGYNQKEINSLILQTQNQLINNYNDQKANTERQERLKLQLEKQQEEKKQKQEQFQLLEQQKKEKKKQKLEQRQEIEQKNKQQQIERYQQQKKQEQQQANELKELKKQQKLQQEQFQQQQKTIQQLQKQLNKKQQNDEAKLERLEKSNQIISDSPQIKQKQVAIPQDNLKNLDINNKDQYFLTDEKVQQLQQINSNNSSIIQPNTDIKLDSHLSSFQSNFTDVFVNRQNKENSDFNDKQAKKQQQFDNFIQKLQKDFTQDMIKERSEFKTYQQEQLLQFETFLKNINQNNLSQNPF